jgi:uncharacterized protein (DUF3084 family)
VELSRLKVALASHEHTLVERSNHLSRLAGEVDSKDHQLALANRQIQLRDRRIAELERQLADVYKSRVQEAYGEHARARLLFWWIPRGNVGSFEGDVSSEGLGRWVNRI